jgi:hypothetical protein
MPDTRVTIGALPEATVAGTADAMVVETSGTTKKILIGTLLAGTGSSALLDAHIASITAHPASAITATPFGPLTGVTAQAQLTTAAVLLAALPGTNVTIAAHAPLLPAAGTLQAAINTICDAVVALQTAINGGTA